MTKGQLNQQYLTAPAVLQYREIQKGIVDVNGEMDFVDFLQMIGKYELTKATKFQHAQNSSSVAVGDTTGQTVTGTGTPTIFVTTTVATAGAFRPDDVIKTKYNKNGRIYNVTTAGGQDTHEIRSVDGSNLVFAPGDPLVFSNVALGEGALGRDNVNYPITVLFNQIQALGDTSGVTDIASLQETEFITSSGKRLYWYENNVHTVMRLKRAISGMFLGGQISIAQYSDGSNSTLLDRNGKPAQTSMGLDQVTTSYGSKYNSVTGGVYSLQDIKNESALWLASKMPSKELMRISGSTPKALIDDYTKNLNSSGVTSVRMNVDGKTVDFEVDKFTYQGFTHYFRTVKTLDDQEMYPLNGADIARSIYTIPKGNVQTTDGPRPYLGARYFDAAAINYPGGNETKLENMIFEKEVSFTGEHTRKFDFSTYQALDFAGARFFSKTTF